MKSNRQLRSCTSTTKQEEIAMPELSVDALLQVFGKLSTRDLLRGPRGVCRKWREAALHASLWRGRSLDSDYAEESSVVKVALEVVPCLRKLRLGAYLRSDNLDQETWRLAGVSECAVQELCVSFSNPREAARAVQRQLTNQRLRTLNVHAVEDVSTLGRILAQASGLTELRVSTDNWQLQEVPRNKGPPKWTPPAGTGPESSIRTLHYNTIVEDGLLLWLLHTHRATLESASVILSEPTGDAARLLVKCPALRKLETPVRKELSGLGACPLLESLTIHEYVCSVPQLLPYFRVGGQLLKSLDFGLPLHGVHGSVLQVLQALASTGRAALEELDVGELRHDEDLDLALPFILRGLPRLKNLVLRNLPSEEVLLDAVAADSAPSLRDLRLYDEAFMDSCQHFCRYTLFKRLVQRNPQLHVLGLPPRHRCQEVPLYGEWECDCCVQGLHPCYPDSDMDRTSSFIMGELSSDDDDHDDDDDSDEEGREEKDDDDDDVDIEKDEADTTSSHLVLVKEQKYEGVFGHEPHEDCSVELHTEDPNRWLWIGDM